METWHATTILTVQAGRVVVAGDGQVSLGSTVIRPMRARCVRSAAMIRGSRRPPMFTLFERLEAAEQYPGQRRGRRRACKGLAHGSLPAPSRSDDAVADRERTLVLTGTGDVLEPERDVM